MSMFDQSYTDSGEYQQEIAQQYNKRVFKFSREQVLDVIRTLYPNGLPAVDEIKISEARAGNMNATYVTPKIVIKLNQDRKQQSYIANKIVSDRSAGQWPVVKVLVYDNFDKTSFEALIMERTRGTLLLDDIFELKDEDQAVIFKQVLAVVRQLFTIKFKDFGWVNFDGKESYSTYGAFLKKEFDEYIVKIKTEKLCAQEDVDKVEAYFNRNLFVFREDEPVFVHTDMHMGNILHEGRKLTALIDFDWSLRAPKVRGLLSLLGFIDRPQQFVEGTKDFPKYKGKNFYHLLPVLKSEFPDVFSDPQLLRKLNLLFISEGVMWISENWSAEWNKEMIKNLVDNELAEGDLNQTYYGKVLSRA